MYWQFIRYLENYRAIQILSMICLEPFCLLRALYRESLNKVYLICITIEQFLKEWQMLYAEDFTWLREPNYWKIANTPSLLYNKLKKLLYYKN